MTNKEQIIIDEMNVIVQQCIFWQEGHCDCYQCENRYPHCLDYPNCYFKQLARKTQECEELKADNKRLVGEISNYVFDDYEELDSYRKALEEIEGMLQVIVEGNKVYPLQSNLYKILDIISKAKVIPT